jgi:gliding motility-associated lipoprotein GldD
MKFYLLVLLLSLIIGCKESNIPKQRAFFRIDLPEHQYQKFDTTCPYTFPYSKHAFIVFDERHQNENCWMNIYYPKFKAMIHISYKEVSGNLNVYLEDSRTLVYKHTIKANDINEYYFAYNERKNYGILYSLEGNMATALQFHATDSAHHFLRGSLYFNHVPNEDSIAPVLQFIKTDIEYMLQELSWK